MLKWTIPLSAQADLVFSITCPLQNVYRECEQWDEEVKAEVSGPLAARLQHISHICQLWVTPEEIAHMSGREDLSRSTIQIL